MDYYLAIYSSVTLANRVKKHMPRDGDYVGVVHTPKGISKGGCSYALRFKQHKLSQVKEISENLNVKIKALYKEKKVDGEKTYTEM